MTQETFDILMDPVRHLHSAIDYSMITLDTCWDTKAKRIYNPKAEIQEQSEPVAEDQPEPMAKEKPEVLADGRSEQQRPDLPLFPCRFGYVSGHKLIPGWFVLQFLRESWLLSRLSGSWPRLDRFLSGAPRMRIAGGFETVLGTL
ncbi:hypothetical protein PIB30_104596 [Stylosanthes scabra]|uniref:Uncharacterized protein n=1 Tax=Stylosanthes scabra TaxID=79078 RepID=A0ABU6TZQ0_9FABA|nr:hypothetical protein [Stylosanthes scabra]